MARVRAADFAYFDTTGPVALAHRGGALHGPNVGRENTLAAFRTAVDLGYRYLETDVHATKDGVVVVLHDDRLDRVADDPLHRGAVADLTWDQLRAVRVGGEPVARLEDLLEELPDARVNIDLKAGAAVAPACQTILRCGALDRVCVGSFSQRHLAQARVLMGRHLATAAGAPGIAALRLGPGWVTRWLRTPAPVLQVPRTYRLAGATVEVVTPELVEHLHHLGKHVHVWTIDDADEMRELLDMGVDGIVSDRIDVLRDVLAERGQWRP